jgi:hypothetical protein
MDTVFSLNKDNLPSISKWNSSKNELLNKIYKERHNQTENISIFGSSHKNLTFVRDFSMTTNRGMYIRVCGDFSYKAYDFAYKPLPSIDIDWINKTNSTCKLARFRGFYSLTFTLKNNTDVFEGA